MLTSKTFSTIGARSSLYYISIIIPTFVALIFANKYEAGLEKLSINISLAFILLVTIARAINSYKLITGPISNILKIADEVLAGDTIKAKKEFDKISSAIEAMKVKLDDYKVREEQCVNDKQQKDNSKNSALLKVLRNMVQIAMECSQTSTLMTKMSRGVMMTNSEIQTMASSVEEMRASIGEVARNVDLANKSADDSKISSQRGVEGAEKANKSIKSINTTVSETKDLISYLRVASEQIGDIIGQIESIAKQTNLLALNATIEAARAGDAGKGFAVVANEVKNLATQTGKSTDDVREKITALREKMSEIITAMDSSAASVNEGEEVIVSLTSNLNQIYGAVEGVAHQMTEISGIMTEQSAASAEIADSASRVANIADNNSSEIAEVIHSAKNISHLLNEQVESFKDLGPLAIIEIAKNDHINFKSKIIETIAGELNQKSTDLANHHTCRLGKWYDTASAEIKAMQSYKDIQDPHRTIHALGIEILQLHENRKTDTALAKMEEMEKISHVVIDLLEKLYHDVEKHQA